MRAGSFVPLVFLFLARPYVLQTQGDVPPPVLVVAILEVVAQVHSA
jgi:hypothetical protein